MFFSNVTIIFNKYLLDIAGFRESATRPASALLHPFSGSWPREF